MTSRTRCWFLGVMCIWGILAGFGPQPNAHGAIDEDEAHVVIKPDGTALTGEARVWVRDFAAATEQRWLAGGGSNAAADLKRFKEILAGRFLPAAGEVLVIQPGQVLRQEVCGAEIHAGCWYYERDDRAVSGSNIVWTYQESPTGADGAYLGWHFPDLAGRRDYFHASIGGPHSYIQQFLEDQHFECEHSSSWMIAGSAARRAVASESSTCLAPPPPGEEGGSARPATMSTIWYPGTADILRPQPDDPAVPNSPLAAPRLPDWTQSVARDLLRPENKAMRDWIAGDIVSQRAPAPPDQTGTTSVSGANDAEEPLVVDPTANPTDPLTADFWEGTTAMWLRMPVTKAVAAVTLGDFAVSPTCTAPTKVYVTIREYVGGAFEGTPQTLVFSSAVNVDQTPRRLKFELSEPVVLRKGRGYGFVVSRWDSTSCRHLRQTTWSHNRAQVDGGSAQCTTGPYVAVDGGGGFVRQRMFHIAGQDDASFGCVDAVAGSRRFDASMPTGWLVSYREGSVNDILGGTVTYETRHDICKLLSSQPLGAGGQPVFWRPAPDPRDDYVCMWRQFAPPGQSVPDGWYYALPWRRERDAQPRDAYLKLDVIDYGRLLRERVPVIRYDSEEEFYLVSPGAMTDFYTSEDIFGRGNSLEDDEGMFAISNPYLASNSDEDGFQHLTLDYLGAQYPSVAEGLPARRRAGSLATSDDAVDALGENNRNDTYVGDSAQMEARPGYGRKIYMRAAHGSDGKLWLQYWMFYYYNALDIAGIGLHEGDWEMIQVAVTLSGAPIETVYSQHSGGERCAWAASQHIGTSPIVYVARASHAAYYSPGRVDNILDRADGDGRTLTDPDAVSVSSADPSWVAWPGRWGGASEGGVPGPKFSVGGLKWGDPTAWANSVEGCSA